MCAFLCRHVQAQENVFFVSGSYVRGVLSLGSVNNTLDRTVFDWNRFFGLSMEPFEHFSTLSTVTGRIGYRFDRDYEIFASYFRFDRELSNGFQGPATDGTRYDLSLRRSLGSENAAVGITYFFPPLRYDAEAYISVEVGSVHGFAEANTHGTHTVKLNDADSTYVFHSADAKYSKTRMFVGVGTGASLALFPSVKVAADLVYKLAKLGKLDGTITVEQGSFEEPSISEFDFSVLLFCVGLRIEF